ncbi:hypothetical protein [Candidatus Protochlamydia phocaeensis]|uniref:hypothetical protein n=1 Tax=Candidatus Protochlamydia phocaeensis TaxID=1414722 RepID=UPI00083934B8|nr:hypothetical protein [Candidatus Protochlamydia phocaeensis]
MSISGSPFISPIDPQPFYKEVKTQWAFIVKEGLGNPGKNPKDGGERAYQVYMHTYHSYFRFIILGPDRLRNEEKLVGNVKLIVAQSKKKSREDSDSLSGSILGEKQWSLLVNDAFILGGMHAGKDFHIATPKKQERFPSLDKLWNASTHSLRPLGREIIILKLSGYKCVDAHNLGIVFCCCFSDQIPKSLTELRNRVKALDSLEVQQILENPIDDELQFQKPSNKDDGNDHGKAPLKNA